MNLLIPYVYLYNHNDPLFDEFTYGDSGKRARQLKNDLKKGDYLFFHTSIGGKKYVTAYYVVDRALDTAKAIKDRNIVAKYKNPHIHIKEFLSGERTDEDSDVVVFGDPITSRILERPLLFNKTLAEKLSLNIKFPRGRTETQAIGSATRQWRELTDEDIEIILKAIELYDKEARGIETVLSTDEVTEIIEKDIEGFIEKNPCLIGESPNLEKRQLDTPVGRIDLLFEDKKGNLIVVELKLNKIGRDAINQLRRYMDWVKKETKKEVTGVIVCKGVMPTFEEDFKKLKNIKILCYGWQLKVYSWGEMK
jgi:hypothetical protein